MGYNILVPLDGTEIAGEIVPYVQYVTARPEADVTLLHVLPDLTRYDPTYIESARKTAVAHMDGIFTQLSTVVDRLHCEFRMGDPVSEILKFAALQRTSLIVMPTHGRKGFERLLSGSVTEHVMRQSHCPMLLSHVSEDKVPDASDKPRFNRILVPLDGTEQGLCILPVVEEFASLYQSEVILFHDNLGLSDTGNKLEGDGVGHQLEAQRLRLADAGLTVSLQYNDAGKPADDIIEAVSTSSADLIAMTTHGRSGVDRLAYGSIVEHVLRHATRPLLVLCTAPGATMDYVEKYLG